MRVAPPKRSACRTMCSTMSRFREAVIEEFADAYLRGETPIPCVRCNQTVKFHDLLETARDLGAAAMATGQYVRRKQVNQTAGGASAELHRAMDPARDQSYTDGP